MNAAPKGGVPFVWAADQSNLSTSQKLALQKAPNGTDQGATAGQNRLNYIRGDRSKEGTNPSNYTESKPYRQRQSRQGDIVNSEVWTPQPLHAVMPLVGITNLLPTTKTAPP